MFVSRRLVQTFSRNLAPRVVAPRRAQSTAAQSSNNWLQYGIIAALAGGAVGAYLYFNKEDKAPAAPAPVEEKKSVLNPKEFIEFPLIAKKQVSPNTAIYRFALPNPSDELALPVASFILAKADIGEEKPVVRPYTPVTYDEKGYFELVVKSYPQGKLSKYIGNLKIGDKLAVKGPIPKIEYKPNMKKHIGMIAGGSGVTPMLQVAHQILKNPDDKTTISLIFANQTADDILLKDRIDAWAAKYPDRFKVYYTLDKPPKDWKGGVGFVTEKMVTEHIPKPGDDTLVLVCGPPPMMNAVSGNKTPDFQQGEVSGVLKALGYNESMVYKF